MFATLNAGKFGLRIAAVCMLFLGSFLSVQAQGLNWEGQTGALTTPFAYTMQTEGEKITKPQVSFHYLNGGEVLGNHFQASATVGVGKRFEFGYTRNLVAKGDNALSPVFSKGFNIFHAKLNVVQENTGKKKWVPAISGGFVLRTNVKRVGGYLANKEETNGDVYVVATKTITEIKGLPIVLSGGVKGTNASIMGIAGNSPRWEARAFGGAAFVVKGPSKSTLIFGAEAAQQPKYVKGLPGATIPTTLDYFVRIIPSKTPLAVDFAIVQAAGKIMPGVDVKARARFGMGISYKF